MRGSSETSGRGLRRVTPHSRQRTKVNSSSVVLSYSCSRPDHTGAASGLAQWAHGTTTFLTGAAGTSQRRSERA